ncbi:MAG: condensation domain-containing protein [Gordonia sp. (in: high G+C Gram-positive bacteria)]|uniref:condensation domain-containing protein n=1 Tax=Gordonia sp. (in: high G+C Gram-positive bacteria) TaxID=84139 RepID=UPI0039E3DD20
MVDFGLIDEWRPTAGRVTTWSMSPNALDRAARAPVHPVPPSHQQEEYLRTALRNADAGFRFSRLCLLAFDFQGPLHADALGRAINGFLRRHDTYRSWFSLEDDGTVARHVVTPETIEMTPTSYGELSGAEIVAHVQETTPGPFRWDCFTFGAVERDTGFTLYAAVDHLNTDGMSQAMTCRELISLYLGEAFGADTELPEVAGYLDYCAHERSVSAGLDHDSPHVRRWLDLVRADGGRLPSFPLPLRSVDGDDDEAYTRSAHRSAVIFDEAAAQRFAEVGKAHGGNMIGSLLAVAAVVAQEFTGRSSYLGMTPKSTRGEGPGRNSIGWFTSLIPVPIEVGADVPFTSLVGPAFQSYLAGKELTDVSFHRVLQLVEPGDGIDVAPGWSVPMVSYIDVRRLPGVELLDAIDVNLFGNRGSSEEVFLWVNRFPKETMISFLFPDTPQAHESIERYLEAFTRIMNQVATTGDYRTVVPAAAR